MRRFLRNPLVYHELYMTDKAGQETLLQQATRRARLEETRRYIQARTGAGDDRFRLETRPGLLPIMMLAISLSSLVMACTLALVGWQHGALAIAAGSFLLVALASLLRGPYRAPRGDATWRCGRGDR